MKVYPDEDDTFTLTELWSALQLIRQNAAIDNGSHQLTFAQNSPARADGAADPAGDDLSDDELTVSQPPPGIVPAQTQPPPDIVPARTAQPSTLLDSAAQTAQPSTLPAAQPVPTVTAQPLAQAHANPPASSRWYTITVGRETGVFQGWHSAHIHVVGVPGACFARHPTRAAAEGAYTEALAAGGVTQVPA
ncbi:uncharacterized protein F5147DRAFT_768436 [Suillus discolor]|uniref:Ribonuclease H1 N-terminal domain-containing protein n=1 Tax=Suillus discolor TaxID=1912936 RepID=A0A9P7JYZ7_9AGAM|nr:uncharacterized protein F5147DRAFT_768436 [Suillus discolor]KAG2117052.1 hypothetical protein F5147DRAFT_768436 [Suillus discolor]